MHICLYISPLDIYLFISIFAQLEKGCVTCTFSISHFSFPVRHLHFRYSCSCSCSRRWISLFLFSGSKNQMQSKLFIVCLRNMKKKCQNFFCIAAAVAQLKVHVCVRVWHVACSELDLHMCRANTCPVQRRFSISTCRSSRRRATRIEKETTWTWDHKKTIVLSARLWNTLLQVSEIHWQ